MSKKKYVILIIVIILVIASLGAILYYQIYRDKKEKENENNNIEVQEETIVETVKEEKKVQIFNGNNRPFAVMIDNHSDAWPQAGLNQTYLVYEIIVEGGETRLMALFKGQDVEKIGPVRSSRHYFLDYAMENDAIYTHYGWSPQAESDISTYKVNNINGISYNYGNSTFWRVKNKKAPHNVLTSTSAIKSMAEKAGYRMTTNDDGVLKYVTEEITLEESQQVANNVTIPHSKSQKVKYEYNAETKRYTRYARNKLQKDYTSGEAVTTKNIIIEFADNYTLQDTENKGRQGLSNIGTFDGYYITNGKAIKITCTKSARNKKTVYKDLSGNEIKVNDGNTWINICPKDANIIFE